MSTNDNLFMQCVKTAEKIIDMGYQVGNVGVQELAETLWKLEKEKEEKNAISDANLDYNDEIVEIEEIGELETVDISVSGDNLFYCNNILTKNSFGLPATADFMFGLIRTEELEELGQLMIKQLKNRWGDLGENKRFVVGIDRSKMRLYDAEDSAQEGLMNDSSPKQQQSGNFGRDSNSNNKKPKFDGFK